MRLCVIDLGTNSVRLFIYEQSASRRLHEIHHEKHMVRLGENLFERGSLDEGAFRRTVEAFEHFAEIIKEFQPDRVEAVATSAMREARDRERLIEAVKSAAGITIRVISGAEEAELIAEGIVSNVDLPSGSALLIDLGGGSCEVTCLAEGKTRGSFSIPLGAARAQQIYLKTIPPVSGGEQKLRSAVSEFCRDGLKEAGNFSAALAIGSSGSIRALGELYRKRSGRHTFPRSYLVKLLEKIRPLSRKEIVRDAGVQEKRSDLVLAAMIILDQICEHFGVKRVRPTTYALKDGVVKRMLA